MFLSCTKALSPNVTVIRGDEWPSFHSPHARYLIRKLLCEWDTRGFSQVGHQIFIPLCIGSKEFFFCSNAKKKSEISESSAQWNRNSPPSSRGSWGAWKTWHRGCWLAADWDSQALTLPSACQVGCRGAGPANWLETREVSLRTLLCFRWNFIKICLANISISTKKNFVEIFLTSSRNLSLMIKLVSLVKLKMLVF